MSNRVSDSVDYGASEWYGAESTGVLCEVTCSVEDCESPCKVTSETGSGAFKVVTVWSSDEVSVT